MFLAVTQLPCTWTLGSAANMPGMAMADAWAAGSHAGIGGWWRWKNTVDPAEIYWFHLPITRKDLPAHWHCDGTDLSKIIATLELVAQLVLLKGRLATAASALDLTSRRLSFQFSDNSAVVAATGSWLTTKAPLDKALQAVGWHCHAAQLVPVVSHIAGIRNDWADALSRMNDGAKAAEVAALVMQLDGSRRWHDIQLKQWLELPWRAGSDPCVRKRKR